MDMIDFSRFWRISMKTLFFSIIMSSTLVKGVNFTLFTRTLSI